MRCRLRRSDTATAPEETAWSAEARTMHAFTGQSDEKVSFPHIARVQRDTGDLDIRCANRLEAKTPDKPLPAIWRAGMVVECLGGRP